MSSRVYKDCCCPEGTCSVCCSCFTKLCQSCCPYLDVSGKDRYAAVQYQPLDENAPSKQSLAAARKSLVPTEYFPHINDPSDENGRVIQEEPKSLSRVKQSWSVDSGSIRSAHDIQVSSDEMSEEGELGVGVGFVDYEPMARSSDRDIRICRTPEIELDSDDLEPDDEEYHLAVRSQSKDPSTNSDILQIRMRSEQVPQSAAPRKPCLSFSLYYNEKHNILIVHLLKAYNLPTKRAESSCNPFAEVYILPAKGESLESRLFHQTLDPIFDQTFNVTNLTLDQLRRQILVVRIYLNTKNHFIGGTVFGLEKASLYGGSNTVNLIVFDEEEGLKDSSKGDVLLSITYHPEAGTLEVLIWEASNLKKQDLIGLPNPYMKVNLIFRGSRLSKWRSSALKNTLNPVFNELCVLDVGSMSMDDLQVEVVVMDYDRFGRNSELGSVVFGSDVANISGRNYWKEIVTNPNVSHVAWHVLTMAETSASRGLRSRSRSPTGLHSKRSPVSCAKATGQ